MTELSKTYEPQEMEKRIYERWKKMGYFHADAGSAAAG